MTEKEKETAKPAENPAAKADSAKPAEKSDAAKTDKKDAKAADKKKDGKTEKAKGEKGSDAKKGNKASQFVKGAVSAIKGKFQSIGKKRAEKKAKAKKAKLAEPVIPYVDKPKKPEKHSVYVHKVVQLDKKDNLFSESKFQKVHKISNNKTMIESLRRIGMCLNKADISKLPAKSADKVCFLLINNYEKDTDGLGVGPLNDAYLFALIHHKLGYKIVFLYNPEMAKFLECFEFFLTNTAFALTFYYAGRDSFSKVRHISHGIQFDEEKEILSCTDFGKMIGQKWNGKCRILILNDCSCGGSIFSIKSVKSTINACDIEVLSFSIDKKDLKPKQKRLSQGLLTYYFCKLMRQFPNSNPVEMSKMLTLSLERFKIRFTPLCSKDSLNEAPMFPGADAAFNSQAAPPPVQQQPAAQKPATDAIPIEHQ